MANKMGLQFAGFKELAEKFDKAGGNLKKVTEKALKSTHEYVTPNIHKAIEKHNQTGDTEASIADDSTVKWDGMTASVDIGFNIDKGGLPSIFLMYGTPKHAPNHPGMEKDQNLFDSIYGTKTKKEIKKLQKQIFTDEFEKLGG